MLKCAHKVCTKEAVVYYPINGYGWMPLCREHEEKLGELERVEVVQ